jgi:hypothetical protein
VRKIRVLVANRPRLMRDAVVTTITDQPDMEIVAEAQNEADITELVERNRPDFVVISLDEPESRPGICGFLLGRYPQMKVVAIAPQKNIVVCYWAFVDLRSEKFQSSEEALLNILRGSTPLPGSSPDSSVRSKTVN